MTSLCLSFKKATSIPLLFTVHRFKYFLNCHSHFQAAVVFLRLWSRHFKISRKNSAEWKHEVTFRFQLIPLCSPQRHQQKLQVSRWFSSHYSRRFWMTNKSFGMHLMGQTYLAWDLICLLNFCFRIFVVCLLSKTPGLIFQIDFDTHWIIVEPLIHNY